MEGGPSTSFFKTAVDLEVHGHDGTTIPNNLQSSTSHGGIVSSNSSSNLTASGQTLVKLPASVNIITLRESLLSEAPFITRSNRAFWRKWFNTKQFSQLLASLFYVVAGSVSESGAINVDKLHDIVDCPYITILSTNFSEMYFMNRLFDRDLFFSKLPEVLCFMIISALQTAIPKHYRLYNAIKFREILLDWSTELIGGLRPSYPKVNREWLFSGASETTIMVNKSTTAKIAKGAGIPVHMQGAMRASYTIEHSPLLALYVSGTLNQRSSSVGELEAQRMFEETSAQQPLPTPHRSGRLTPSSSSSRNNLTTPDRLAGSGNNISNYGNNSSQFNFGSSNNFDDSINGNNNNNNNNNNASSGLVNSGRQAMGSNNNNNNNNSSSFGNSAMRDTLENALMSTNNSYNSNNNTGNNNTQTNNSKTATNILHNSSTSRKYSPYTLKITLSHPPSRPLVNLGGFNGSNETSDGKIRERKADYIDINKNLKDSKQHRREVMNRFESERISLRDDMNELRNSLKTQLRLINMSPMSGNSHGGQMSKKKILEAILAQNGKSTNSNENGNETNANNGNNNNGNNNNNNNNGGGSNHNSNNNTNENNNNNNIRTS